jgi:hypothetical protein
MGTGRRAGGPQLLEGAEGGDVGTLELGHAAGEARQAGIDFLVSAGVEELFVEAAAVLLEEVGLVAPKVGFDAGEAALGPFGADEDIDEGALFGAGGVEALFILADEGDDFRRAGFAKDEHPVHLDAGSEVSGGA